MDIKNVDLTLLCSSAYMVPSSYFLTARLSPLLFCLPQNKSEYDQSRLHRWVHHIKFWMELTNTLPFHHWQAPLFVLVAVACLWIALFLFFAIFFFLVWWIVSHSPIPFSNRHVSRGGHGQFVQGSKHRRTGGRGRCRPHDWLGGPVEFCRKWRTHIVKPTNHHCVAGGL